MIINGMMIGERYEILEKIGTGGMSDVYKAKCHKLNRFVAVKVLKQEFSENDNFVSKFRVEAQAAAGLMHPNIVNVYDVGEEDGIYYIVMELVEGITLKQYIEKKARLSVKEATSIAIQICMGIEAAHNNHIIHRDIKPQNVIISKEGKVKVTDFGIAKAATSNTITSNVMGSVHYTSPEQARGGFSDEKSDIYSLGITLFEMLTGRVPFNGETTVAIAIKQIQEPLPSVREYVTEIPLSVEQIVYKCTNKSPDRRYLSMGQLIEDLKKSLMNPEQNFVKIIDPDEESVTRMISDQDRQQIKKKVQPETAKKSKVVAERPVEKKAAVRRVEAVDIEEEDDEDDFDPKMEKITTILAVVAAILIGVIVIFLVGKTLGVFELGSLFGEETVVEDEELVSDLESDVENSQAEVETEDTSSGITVPDIEGKSFAEAVATLEKSGFVVNKTEVNDDTVAAGNVISQTPSGGEKATFGSSVSIKVSLGAEENKVRVPSVVGLSEEDGTFALIEAGLQVGTVTQVTSDDATLTNLICYQSYSVGSYIDAGTAVDIRISTGVGEVSYTFLGSVASPAEEDADYAAGTSTTVVLTTAAGSEVYRQVVDTFPLEINIGGIKDASEGTITFYYSVTTGISTSTDAEGNIVTTGGVTEERSVSRAVKFAKE
ncbi:MAG: Stk1 family PASTA domain-containing Ser/Thr kinase [Eubacteriales bacterium]